MKKLLLTGIATLFLATGIAHSGAANSGDVYYICGSQFVWKNRHSEPVDNVTAYVNYDGKRLFVHMTGGNKPTQDGTDYEAPLLNPPQPGGGRVTILRFSDDKHYADPINNSFGASFYPGNAAGDGGTLQIGDMVASLYFNLLQEKVSVKAICK